MKVFLPFKKELNPYLDEIDAYSNCEFIYGELNEYAPEYRIVNIHWPEAIFGWKEPSKEQLDELESTINVWKENSVLIYTKHDYQRNKGTTTNFTKLFNLIEKHSDVWIHLGIYSKEKYQQKYPKARHEVIYHPLFEKSFKVFSKQRARELLGIDQNALVVIAPGNIRSFSERKMILNSFNALSIENKVLISTNMRSELKRDFPGRVRLRKYFDVRDFFVNRFKKRHLPPRYIFTYKAISNEELSLKISAADIVMVPRKNIMNSGIVFLGLTFGKIVAGPDIGNIKEQLQELNFPIFNPNSISSVTRALEKGIGFAIFQRSCKKYHTQVLTS